MSRHYDFVHLQLRVSPILSALIATGLRFFVTSSKDASGGHVAAFPHCRMQVKISEEAHDVYPRLDFMLVNRYCLQGLARAISHLFRRDQYKEEYTLVSTISYRITFRHMSVLWRNSQWEEEDLLAPMLLNW